MEQRATELADRAARLSGRLRGLYQAEKQLKESRQAEVGRHAGGGEGQVVNQRLHCQQH